MLRILPIITELVDVYDWHDGLMASVLDSRYSVSGSIPGWGHYVVFLCETCYSQSTSLYPKVKSNIGKL